MATLNEYAQFSSIVYAKTQENELSIPTGWVEERPWQSDTLSGFSAGAYKKGSEIVISFTGTNGALEGDFVWANIPAGAGLPSAQVLSAIKFYLDVRDANPGATSSLTGHSLGGGLSSLMAVYFDKSATTFAPAPFMLRALNMATLGSYQATLLALGKSDAAFDAYTPNPTALYTARQANVEAHTIQGEILVDTLGRGGTIVDPAKDYFYDAGSSVPPVSLHSILLHAAVIRSPEFRQAVSSVQSALPMIGDESLYASNPQTSRKPDYMSKLMKDEWGWTGFGSHTPLRRFADDLLILAPSTYGMASGTGIAAALVVAAIEYRYFKDAATATQLFTFADYGLHFKYSDIGASSYKSLPKLVTAVSAFLTPEESTLLHGKLVKQDAWHIQSGLGGMTVHACDDKDAMIGGANSDGLWGGAGGDVLIGGADNDVLAGEAGNDYLLGGIGNATYIFSTGDGTDTVLDTAGSGSIVLNGVTLTGGALVDGTTNVWKNAAQGITYTLKRSGANQVLIISKDGSADGIRVHGWQSGQLGLNMAGSVAPPATSTLTGADSYSDALTGSGGSDRILGLSGNDALDGSAGDDVIEGGLGDDLIGGNSGSDLIYGGAGRAMILSAAGLNLPGHLGSNGEWAAPAGAGAIWTQGRLWGIYASSDANGPTYIIDGGGPLGQDTAGDIVFAGDDEDRVVGGLGDDYIDGGLGNDNLTGHGGNDVMDGGDGEDYLQGDGVILPGYYTSVAEIQHGNDVLDGGAGADSLVGGGKDDGLFGGTGDDLLWGEAENEA